MCRQEDFPMCARRTPAPYVLREQGASIGWKRQRATVARLAFPYVQQAGGPVNVFQLKAAQLARPHTETRKQGYERAVANTGVLLRLASLEYAFEFLG
jgi:hypothetical protein